MNCALWATADSASLDRRRFTKRWNIMKWFYLVVHCRLASLAHRSEVAYVRYCCIVVRGEKITASVKKL